MNAPRLPIGTATLARGVTALLLALRTVVQAQDTPPPAPAPAPEPAEAPAQTEMQKWITTTDAQWQAALKRDVTDVHLTELEKVKQQYVALLGAAVTKASSAGDLNGAVALRNEEKRFAGTNLLPEQDEATDGATVKQIRVAVRAQIAKLEKDNAIRTKALHAKYDLVLAGAQTQLTKAQRIEDALLVKAKREEVKAAWAVPETVAPQPVNNPTPQPATNSAARRGLADKATLEKGLVGTKWRLPPNKQKPEGASLQFEKNGVLVMNWAPARGKWEIQPNGKVVISVSAKDPTAQTEITFDRSLQDMHWIGGAHDGKTFHRW